MLAKNGHYIIKVRFLIVFYSANNFPLGTQKYGKIGVFMAQIGAVLTA